MKLGAGVLTFATLTLAVAACWVDRRSTDFKCGDPAECGAGRTCSNGYCVTQPIDARAIDASPCGDTCVAAGGTCTGVTCTFDCTATTCLTPIVCPSGIPCIVNCAAAGSCMGGIDCDKASSCTINCTGSGSCSGPIDCSNNACDVACSGPSSCSGGVSCAASCSCDVNCGGLGSCTPPATCPSGNQCTDGDGCTPHPSCSSC